MALHIPDSYAIGQDVARTRDRAAIVVLQRRGDTGQVLVRSAQFGVGVDLQKQEDMGCATIKALDTQIPGRDRLFYVVDRNGIGLGVAEGVHRRVMKEKSLGLRRYVKVIGGDAVAGTSTGRDEKVSWWHNVGRDLLTHRANAALRTGELSITEAEGNGAAMLATEISRLALKQTPSGKQRVDHKAGEHDDLYMAMCWGFWLLGEFKIGGVVHNGTGWAGASLDTPVQRPRRAAPAPGATAPAPSPEKSREKTSGPTVDAAVLALLRAEPVIWWSQSTLAEHTDGLSRALVLGALHRLRAAGSVERDPADPARWRAAA